MVGREERGGREWGANVRMGGDLVVVSVRLKVRRAGWWDGGLARGAVGKENEKLPTRGEYRRDVGLKAEIGRAHV